MIHTIRGAHKRYAGARTYQCTAHRIHQSCIVYQQLGQMVPECTQKLVIFSWLLRMGGGYKQITR